MRAPGAPTPLAGWWTPARRRGVEQLDDPRTPAPIREAAMRDLARSNALFGGTRAALGALATVLPHLPPRATLADVGAGMGDIAASACVLARTAGVTFSVLGVDASAAQLGFARDCLDSAVAADARHLPLRAGAAHVALCSQVLHHFTDDDVRRVVAELHRVSSAWVVISDLRRSWIAAAGFWVASLLLRFHPVTRRDGVTSVLRGFTAHELEALIFESTGVRPMVRHGLFWRLTAAWRTTGT